MIKEVWKCDIDLIQQFIKQEVNTNWLILTTTLLPYFVNENSFKQSNSWAAAHLHSNSGVFKLI